VVQETVVSVCKQIKQFKADPSRGSFKGWLLNLTRWRIIDQARKRKPEFNDRLRRSRRPPGSEGDGTATEERVPDPAGNALETVWDDEWKENLIQAALKSLANQIQAKHYQVFFLSYIRQVAPQKVAQTVGVTIDQVYLINHRTAPQFKKILARLDTDGA
jgi:RNA polymerase sigma-70 factor (ECF subfamily)